MERKDLTLRNIPRADRQYRIEGDEEVVVRGFFDRYFAEEIDRDRRAVEERLANGVVGRGERPGGLGQGVIGSAGDIPLDPRLTGLEEGARSQLQLGQDPL